jgi:8-oxo-dGTP pyrophosphatase MutT (NUDIX family)
VEEDERALAAAVRETLEETGIALALPPDTVGDTAAIITAVEAGLTFTLNGW